MVNIPMEVPLWLREEYPFRPRTFFTPGGARMSYADEGGEATEAVVMLHGNPTWSFFYRGLIKELSSRIRCIAPDHIGMGLSDKPQDYDYTLETRIRDVLALIEFLQLRTVHLVVHDWGGAIGFGVATRRPELIGKITILNTAAFISDRIPRRIALCRLPFLGSILVRGLNGFARPAVNIAMAHRKLTRVESRGYLLPYGNWNDRVAVDGFIQDIPMEKNHQSRIVLSEIEQRLTGLDRHSILFVWGMADFCFDGAFLNRWLELFPKASVTRLDGVGHYVLDDGGSGAVSPILRFITGIEI